MDNSLSMLRSHQTHHCLKLLLVNLPKKPFLIRTISRKYKLQRIEALTRFYMIQRKLKRDSTDSHNPSVWRITIWEYGPEKMIVTKSRIYLFANLKTTHPLLSVSNILKATAKLDSGMLSNVTKNIYLFPNKNTKYFNFQKQEKKKPENKQRFGFSNSLFEGYKTIIINIKEHEELGRRASKFTRISLPSQISFSY